MGWTFAAPGPTVSCSQPHTDGRVRWRSRATSRRTARCSPSCTHRHKVCADPHAADASSGGHSRATGSRRPADQADTADSRGAHLLMR